MKIAILHEMLVKFGGAEKVVQSLLKIFPDADLFTLLYDEEKMGTFFPKHTIHPQVFGLTSQKVYAKIKKQRWCLPFLGRSVEQLDFSNYDIVIASSSSMAHGAITKPETKFIVYYHSPSRYLWDWTNEYKKDIGFEKGIKGYFLNALFLKLRQWDYIASQRNDVALANSKNTQNRITKYYKKESILLYPPVETRLFEKNVVLSQNMREIFLQKSIQGNDYYLMISALTEFKRIDIAIQGFNTMLDKKLVIIGKGDYRENLEKLVTGENIFFLGAIHGDDFIALMQQCQGLIFPGEEDFGIVPVEAMSAGKPVFAYRGGGLLETVIENKTGMFFDDKNGSDFIEKFLLFEEKINTNSFKETDCKNQAERFSEEQFKNNLMNIISGI